MITVKGTPAPTPDAQPWQEGETARLYTRGLSDISGSGEARWIERTPERETLVLSLPPDFFTTAFFDRPVILRAVEPIERTDTQETFVFIVTQNEDGTPNHADIRALWDLRQAWEASGRAASGNGWETEIRERPADTGSEVPSIMFYPDGTTKTLEPARVASHMEQITPTGTTDTEGVAQP